MTKTCKTLRRWVDETLVLLRLRGGKWYAVAGITSVLGAYETPDAAFEAAKTMLETTGLPRLCSWRDVVAARKENKRLNDLRVREMPTPEVPA